MTTPDPINPTQLGLTRPIKKVPIWSLFGGNSTHRKAVSESPASSFHYSDPWVRLWCGQHCFHQHSVHRHRFPGLEYRPAFLCLRPPTAFRAQRSRLHPQYGRRFMRHIQHMQAVTEREACVTIGSLICGEGRVCDKESLYPRTVARLLLSPR